MPSSPATPSRAAPRPPAPTTPGRLGRSLQSGCLSRLLSQPVSCGDWATDTRHSSLKRSSGASSSTEVGRGRGRGRGTRAGTAEGGCWGTWVGEGVRGAAGYLPALHHVLGHRHLELQVGVVLGPGVAVPHGSVVAVGVPLELLLSPGKNPSQAPARPRPLTPRHAWLGLLGMLTLPRRCFLTHISHFPAPGIRTQPPQPSPRVHHRTRPAAEPP